MDCHQQVRPDNASNNIHLIAFQQAVGKLFGDIGFALIIGIDDFGIHTAKLATLVLHGQINRILHLLANNASATR